MSRLDAVVVGSGPNGLAAAITLAEQGLAVRVYEAAATPGGGCRTAELTLPGFAHDVCATVHALAGVSPFLRGQSLDVEYLTPEIAYAHPLDGGRAALLYRDVERTAASLDDVGGWTGSSGSVAGSSRRPGSSSGCSSAGRSSAGRSSTGRSPSGLSSAGRSSSGRGSAGHDGRAWRRLIGPLVRHADDIWPDALGTLRTVPRHPVSMARFGLPGLLPATTLAQRAFDSDAARALLVGAAAHSMRRLDAPLTAAYGLVLAMSAHATGWPVVRGGSGALVAALVDRLSALGGEIVCDHPVTSLAELPPARLRLLDIGPRALLELAGDELPSAYARGLRRFRYGGGVFKLDYALSGPVPWSAPDCARAGTLHLGGSWDEIVRSEAMVESGLHPESPYVLAVQPTVIDPSRAPAGQHVLWAYCHVPPGSWVDMTERIEAQIERFAPGFRDLILARHARNAREYEAYDANYVGGDINAGQASLRQSMLGPVARWSRYRVPLPGTYLCSSSTAPGGGVHGMSGLLAAREAMRAS